MPTSADLDMSERLPFPVSQPKLLTSKPRSQVFQCDYTDESGNSNTPCIVKIFSSRARIAYEKELAVYLAVDCQSPHVTPSKIWSGSWSASHYLVFLAGKLPSMLRGRENQVDVIMLTYLQNATPLSRIDTSNRLEAVKSALRALLQLHEIGIVHGDPSAGNVLIRGIGPRVSAVWIDFSSSIMNPSKADISFE
jgi:serine/threonine protein kinase